MNRKSNKQIRYYIRNQTKTKNDAQAESQPIPDITVRRAQKIIPKEETKLNDMLQEDMKCGRLNKNDKFKEYQHLLNAIKNTYGMNEYQTIMIMK